MILTLTLIKIVAYAIMIICLLIRSFNMKQARAIKAQRKEGVIRFVCGIALTVFVFTNCIHAALDFYKMGENFDLIFSFVFLLMGILYSQLFILPDYLFWKYRVPFDYDHNHYGILSGIRKKSYWRKYKSIPNNSTELRCDECGHWMLVVVPLLEVALEKISSDETYKMRKVCEVCINKSQYQFMIQHGVNTGVHHEKLN